MINTTSNECCGSLRVTLPVVCCGVSKALEVGVGGKVKVTLVQ